MEKDELKLSVKLDKVYELDLNADLSIDKAKINSELGEQPSKFAYYAMLYELAKAKTSMLKSTIDTKQAELNFSVRVKAEKDEKKLTESMVQAAITLDKSFKELNDKYLISRREEGLLYVAREAFEQRKDMLISIASNMRQEIDTTLNINKDMIRKKMIESKGGGK